MKHKHKAQHVQYKLVVTTRGMSRTLKDPKTSLWETKNTQGRFLPKAHNPHSAKNYAMKHIEHNIDFPKGYELLRNISSWGRWKHDHNGTLHRSTGILNGIYMKAEIIEVYKRWR